MGAVEGTVRAAAPRPAQAGAGDEPMSRPCRVATCGRPVSDDSDALGCPVHWARVRYNTKVRLAEYGDGAGRGTQPGYDAAVDQALAEMNEPPVALAGPIERWIVDEQGREW